MTGFEYHKIEGKEYVTDDGTVMSEAEVYQWYLEDPACQMWDSYEDWLDSALCTWLSEQSYLTYNGEVIE